jgi:hypothetical protein
MATKKQRSRRAKTFRHEYGFVVPDEEGNEVEVSGAELRGKAPVGENAPAKSAGKAPAGKSSGRAAPQKPTWERALKRGGLTGAGLALLMVFVLHAPIVLGLVYGVMFIPLTYWMEGMTYRWYQKRQAQGAAGSAKKTRAEKR